MALAKVRERRLQANYLNVGTGETVNNAFLGSGFTDLNEEPGAQTKSKRYVNNKSTTKGVVGYEWQTPFNAEQIRTEEAIEFICDIGELQKTGPEAEADYYIVDMDKPIVGKDNTFRARYIRVAIEVSTYGNEDGEMTCEGNFLGIGDLVVGEFSTVTKTFTAGKGSEPEIENGGN